MKKAVIYARVSSLRQKKKGTIASQIAELKRQVVSNGDVLVKEYVDDGHSGAKLDRPALEELRKDIKTDLFESVYFLNTDRIAREVTYQTIIVGEILKQDKQIIINGQDYIHNPENKFTLTVLGAVAELERAKIMERYTRGKTHKLRQGILMSHGHLTLGYNYIPRSGSKPASFKINKTEAETIQFIYKAYAEDGWSKSKIIRHLEDNDHLTKKGNHNWEWRNLENILKNHSYMGVKYFNTRTLTKEKSDPIKKVKYGKVIYKDQSEWLPVKVPIIIPEKLFIQVQKRFERDGKKYTNPNETQLLSKLVKCGEYGCAFTAYKRYVHGYRYDTGKIGKEARTGKIYHKVSYVCSKRIRQTLHSKKTIMKRCSNPQMVAHKLEKIIWDAVTGIMTDPEQLKQCVIGYTDNKQAVKQKLERELEDISKIITQLSAEKQTILEKYASGEIDKDDYSQKCFKFDEEIQLTKAEQSSVLKNLTGLKGSDALSTSLEHYCATLKLLACRASNFDLKRQVLLNHITKIKLSPEILRIHGNIESSDNGKIIKFITELKTRD